MPRRHSDLMHPPEKSGKSAKSGKIRAGIGGWTFEPWRGVFYPDNLAQAKELSYASRHLPVIEVNGTYYSTQKPPTFARWASETPDDFIFTLKGPRYATNRRELAGAGDSITRFLDSGIIELGDKLGPLLWQFAPTKKFDEADFAAFLELLPEKFDGRGCFTPSKCGMIRFRRLRSSTSRGRSPWRSCLPTMRNIPPLPM